MPSVVMNRRAVRIALLAVITLSTGAWLATFLRSRPVPGAVRPIRCRTRPADVRDRENPPGSRMMPPSTGGRRPSGRGVARGTTRSGSREIAASTPSMLNSMLLPVGYVEDRVAAVRGAGMHGWLGDRLDLMALPSAAPSSGSGSSVAVDRSCCGTAAVAAVERLLTDVLERITHLEPGILGHGDEGMAVGVLPELEAVPEHVEDDQIERAEQSEPVGRFLSRRRDEVTEGP